MLSFCFVFVNLTVIDCDIPPGVTNAGTLLSPSGFTTVNSTVEYTCHLGFRFPSGNTTAESICLDTGAWEAVADCQCK